MKVISLFSGAGGLDLGFVQAGFEIIWSNDIMRSACDTYSANKKYFNAELYDNPNDKYNGKHRIFCGDIRNIKSYKDAVGPDKIDVVIGGFPCQDFSILRGSEAKGRCGITVKRGQLYCHFVRALGELQPKMFIAENVKGLMTANKGKAYEAIIYDFENLGDSWGVIKEYGEFNNKEINGKKNSLEGYHILFKSVVDFSKLGVPQKRERLIIIGLRNDIYKNLLQSHKNFLVQDFEKKLNDKFLKNGFDNFSEFPITPLEIFYGNTLENLKDEYKTTMLAYNKTIKEINSDRQKQYMNSIWEKYSMDIWKDYLSENKYFMKNKLNSLQIEKWNIREEIENSHKSLLKELNYYGRTIDELIISGNINSEILHENETVKKRMEHIPPGENHLFVKNTEYHVTGLMSNIYKRIHPIRPSPTIIACGGGGTWGYHFRIDRQKLTNRERARLQTFPDDFIFKGNAGEIRTQIGNAVPPLASKSIAKELLTILDFLE
jgi:DNA (cytosine-5)-methyltransferase 1